MHLPSEHVRHDPDLLLQKVFDSLNEAVFIVQTGTRVILDVNRAVEGMFGYCREEIIGLTTACLHLNDAMFRRFSEEMFAAYEQVGFFETRYQMRRKDGSIFDSEHCMTPIRDEGGAIVSHVCVVRDISERLKAETLLRTKTLQQAAILDNTCVGITLTCQLIFVWANNRFREMFGYTEEELKGQPLRMIYPTEEAFSRTVGAPYGGIAPGEVCEVELQLMRRDGTLFWAKCYGRAMDPDNLSAGNIWVVEDISKRKLAEEALAEKSRALEEVNSNLAERVRLAVAELQRSESLRSDQNRLLLDLAPEAIVLYDVDLDRLIDANAHAEELFGCSKEDVFASSPLSFYDDDQPDGFSPREHFRRNCDRVIAGEVLTVERRLRDRQGKTLTCQAHFVRMPSPDRQLVRASFIDITERKRMEDELETALAVARKTNEEQRQFLGLISHEIRTPLSIIDGAAQLLLFSACPDSECIKLARRIRAAGSRLTSLVDTCLTDERISSSGWVPDLQDVPLPEIVEEVANMFRKTSDAHEIVTALEGLPKLFRCDPALVKVMFANLVENAVKYSPAGGRIRLEGEAGEGGGITIRISDEGSGIAAEHMERIFDRFYRTWQVPDVPGAGLGLHMVRKIAELHGGGVACDSALGRGTTFRVRLGNGR